MSLDVYLVCPCCQSTLHTDNITHNLGRMAAAADLYQSLWRPEEITEKPTAGDITAALTSGLKRLSGDPTEYRKHNPENGWGNYDGLVEFTERYLEACQQHPDARVEVSR